MTAGDLAREPELRKTLKLLVSEEKRASLQVEEAEQLERERAIDWDEAA